MQYMEALWSLEDKWKLSTHKAIALFACTSFLVIALCFAGAILKWRNKSSTTKRGTIMTIHQEPCKSGPGWAEMAGHPARCSVVMSALIGSVRWSPRGKWETRGPTRLLEDVGWPSHNSASAVWKRPILMGEKCELPRFSGLILYDQRGAPLDQCEQGIAYHEEEKSHPVTRTTLRDLL